MKNQSAVYATNRVICEKRAKIEAAADARDFISMQNHANFITHIVVTKSP